MSKSTPRSAGPLGGLTELVTSPSAAAIALLGAAVIGLMWANSPWAPQYAALRDLPFAMSVGDTGIDKPLLLWINDGLMALFFLLVGLEVKREVAHGALSTPRKAALPVSAAVGGMVVPALLYAALNSAGVGAAGWAVPMATDIAFALGVLSLMGDRVPVSLKVFLAAFAVADDIGAVLVIATFYTASISTGAIAAAAGLCVVLLALNRLGAQNLGLYLAVGAALWLAVLLSGVHATIAGVLLALAIPLEGPEGQDHSPLVHLEHTLHPWVSWLVLPIFALANAGVTFGAEGLDPLHPVALGVGLGLVVGKSVGVPLACWLAVRAGVAELPEGAGWDHVLGVALLGGIGFTMSIFIAGLAFADPVLLDTAKVGILGGSFLAGTLGVATLLWAHRRRMAQPVGAPARQAA